MNEELEENGEFSEQVLSAVNKMEECERSIDEYYKLVDMMSAVEMKLEIKRMTDLLSKDNRNIDLASKLGLTRRKLCEAKPFSCTDRKFLKEKKVEELFAEALEIDPFHPQVLYNSCLIHKDNSNKEKYDECRRLLKQRHPSSGWSCLLKIQKLYEDEKYDEMPIYLEKNYEFLTKQKTPLHYSLVNVAYAYKAQKDKKNFLKAIQNVLALFEDSTWALHELGWYYLNESYDFPEKKVKSVNLAKKYFKKCLSIRPVFPGYNYSLACALEHEGIKMRQQAIDRFTIELKFHPDHKYSLSRRMDLYVDQGEFEKAIEDADLLIKRENIPENYDRRANVMISQGKNSEEIVKYLTDAIPGLKDEKEKAKMYCCIGKMYVSFYQYEEALPTLNLSIEIDPTNLSAYHERADCHSFLGHKQKALSDYDHVIEENKKYDDISMVYFNKGMTHIELLDETKWLYVDDYFNESDTEEDGGNEARNKSLSNFDKSEAVYCFKKLLDEFDSAMVPSIKFEVMYRLSMTYEGLGEYGKGYMMYNKAIEYYHFEKSKKQSINNNDDDEIIKKKKEESEEEEEEEYDMKMVFGPSGINFLRGCEKMVELMIKKHGIEVLLRDRNFDIARKDMQERIHFLEDYNDLEEGDKNHHDKFFVKILGNGEERNSLGFRKIGICRFFLVHVFGVF